MKKKKSEQGHQPFENTISSENNENEIWEDEEIYHLPLFSLKTNYKHNCQFGESCQGFVFSEGGFDCDLFPNEICIMHRNYNFSSKYQFFPLPNKNLLSGKEKHWNFPVGTNQSYIFFDTENNSNEFIIKDDVYQIQGKIMSNVDTIEVLWDQGAEPYLLKNFKSENGNFAYNISFKLGNIKYGENNYLIRGYAGNKVYERIFSLFLVDEHAPEKALEKIHLNKNPNSSCISEWFFCRVPHCLSTYSSEIFSGEDTYTLWFDRFYFGPQTLTLENWTKISYQNTFKESFREPGILTISHQWKEAKTETQLRCDSIFVGLQTEMKVFEDGVIFIKQPWGESKDIWNIYLPESNEILNFHEEYMEKNLKEDAYPIFSLERISNTIVTEEKPYCCDELPNPNWYEKITYDLFSKQLIQRESIDK